MPKYTRKKGSSKNNILIFFFVNVKYNQNVSLANV